MTQWAPSLQGGISFQGPWHQPSPCLCFPTWANGLANGLGWRISAYPSSGHIVKSSEAPLYSLAKLLLLITVLLKYRLWFFCERQAGSNPHHTPVLHPLPHSSPHSFPHPPATKSESQSLLDLQAPTGLGARTCRVPPAHWGRGRVVCRQP